MHYGHLTMKIFYYSSRLVLRIIRLLFLHQPSQMLRDPTLTSVFDGLFPWLTEGAAEVKATMKQKTFVF